MQWWLSQSHPISEATWGCHLHLNGLFPVPFWFSVICLVSTIYIMLVSIYPFVKNLMFTCLVFGVFIRWAFWGLYARDSTTRDLPPMTNTLSFERKHMCIDRRPLHDTWQHLTRRKCPNTYWFISREPYAWAGCIYHPTGKEWRYTITRHSRCPGANPGACPVTASHQIRLKTDQKKRETDQYVNMPILQMKIAKRVLWWTTCGTG